MVKKEVVIVVHHRLGVVAQGMIIGEEVLHPAADHHEEEAFLAAGAGPFQEIEEERDHCHGREIISLLVPFPGLVVALGQMKGNRTSAFKRSDVQEVALHLTGACTEHYKFCLSLHKLSAFLKCFSC